MNAVLPKLQGTQAVVQSCAWALVIFIDTKYCSKRCVKLHSCIEPCSKYAVLGTRLAKPGRKLAGTQCLVGVFLPV